MASFPVTQALILIHKWDGTKPGLDWTGLDAKIDCNIDGSREWAWLAMEVLLVCTCSKAENILCRQVIKS